MKRPSANTNRSAKPLRLADAMTSQEARSVTPASIAPGSSAAIDAACPCRAVYLDDVRRQPRVMNERVCDELKPRHGRRGASELECARERTFGLDRVAIGLDLLADGRRRARAAFGADRRQSQIGFNLRKQSAPSKPMVIDPDAARDGHA